MKSMKRVLGFILVLTMIMSLAACGGKKDGSLSKDEYLKQVKTIWTDINAKGEAIAAATTLQATDPAKAFEEMKTAVETVKPLYVELGELKAPEEYTEQQATIKTGVEASVGMLDLSLKMLELGTEADPDAAKAQEMLEEMQTKAAEWTPALEAMDSTMNELAK